MPTTPSRGALRLAALIGAAAALTVLLRRTRRAGRAGPSGPTAIGGDTWPPVPTNTGRRS